MGSRKTSTTGSDDDVVRGEAAIIGEFLAPLTGGDPGAAWLQDDCASISPPQGCDLVVTTDSLIEGVHFFPGDIPAFKALAVNVSDLIGKGAMPLAYLLNLALPEPPTRGFLTRLAEGLQEAQAAFGCHLIGGDTDRTSGPFTLTVTAVGTLARGSIVRRSGGRAGDIVAVSGTIGDACLGLALRKDQAPADAVRHVPGGAAHLIGWFDRPRPDVAAADLVRDFATAAMDVSDGLAKELARLAAASKVGAEIRFEAVPLSPAAQAMIAAGHATKEGLVGGGEDYQVLFTVAPEDWRGLQAAAADRRLAISQIGSLTDGGEVIWRDGRGRPVEFEVTGWDHF